MKRVLFFAIPYFFSLSLNAADIVDVFGTDAKQSEELIKQYGAQVAEISAKMSHLMQEPRSPKQEKSLNACGEKRNQLINQIKQHYGFSYVDFDTVFYYKDKKSYTTIEVVRSEDKYRLKFLSKNTKPSSQKPPHDLIETMVDYQMKWAQLMLNNQFDAQEKPCPIYHCLPGYSHPELKASFDLFNANAMKEKDLIVRTINQDTNPERRTAAIFLMGHFQNPKEITSFLIKHIRDSDSMVRNAAMRVIGTTLMKTKTQDMDAMPFLTLLDSPYDSDRNKALVLLSTLSASKKNKALLIQQGKDKLMALLRLKQPNNHDIAYSILKKISGKDFGAANFEAWEQWFKKMNG